MEQVKDHLKKYFKKTDFSGLSVFGRGQDFDWEILLAIFLVVVICFVSFSLHVFLGVRAGDIFKGTPSAPLGTEMISKEALKGVVQRFADRAEILEDLQSHKPAFVDPSL